MSETLTDEEREVLWANSRGTTTHYVVPSGPLWECMLSLCARGLMKQLESLGRGALPAFTITDAGRAALEEEEET